jgi:lysophospholipase L1-like esterase
MGLFKRHPAGHDRNQAMNHPFSRAKGFNRRQFVGVSAGIIGAASGISMPNLAQAAAATRKGKVIGPGDVILFQGDSITDAGRSREKASIPNEQAGLGSGYAWLAAGALLVDRPNDQLKIYNRGISGNKVYQLAERWESDCLELKPTLLSVLIGVNDIWHKLGGKYDGTIEVYERDYRALLDRTRKALPKVKFVVCEPFVLRCGAVDEKWFPEFDRYRAAAKRVAEANHAIFVPFQAMFDQAIKFAPPEHWAKDGVHPSSPGASLMAHEWLKKVA